MREWAQSSVAERRLSNVQLIGGDAEATGLPRASFDLAHARLLLINVRHPDRILSEMVAVVRSGSWPGCCGKAKWRILPVCWDWVTHSRPPGQAATGGMRHGRAYQDGRAAA
jgi:ubiquinone/menaquinone biosynthesis C-methylase UbiE